MNEKENNEMAHVASHCAKMKLNRLKRACIVRIFKDFQMRFGKNRACLFMLIFPKNDVQGIATHLLASQGFLQV